MNDIPASPRCFMVLPAAGSGRRMQAKTPKQYLPLHGKPLLQHSLERLGPLPEIERIVVVLAADDPYWSAVEVALPDSLRAKIMLARGGAERSHSVLAGLHALSGLAGADDWVFVHDAVRPCAHPADLLLLRQAVAGEQAGGLLAQPLRETLKEAGDDGLVLRTLPRERLWLAATPQLFRHGVLCRALEQALAGDQPVTDEAAAVERLGLPVKLVMGRADNIKVTWPVDLALASALLELQESEGGNPACR